MDFYHQDFATGCRISLSGDGRSSGPGGGDALGPRRVWGPGDGLGMVLGMPEVHQDVLVKSLGKHHVNGLT